ncbi:MAG: alpha/beta hydrolase-fold protein [Reichenbachiella sp.]|uniref:alpha/beta hydrolase n=2 Tax=Reichenbachiella sp. TaxID=2184521 RepID=UPI0032631CB2
MYQKINILLIFLLLGTVLQAQDGKKAPFNIGEVRTIESQHLDETRTLNIYLPNDYHPDSAAHQTIYLLDGSAHEDFLHIVGLVQFFDLQLNAPPTIVVGIANVDRKRDFTFHTDDAELKEQFPTTGGSAKFMAFVEEELQPFIQENYNVNQERILIGQSLGGLMASEILLKKPQLFSKYLIVSPSLWWDNESMYNQMDTLLADQNFDNTEVIISVGQEHPMMIKEAAGLYQSLALAEKKNLKVHYQYFEKEDHATVLHVSIYEAFKILYQKEK